MCDVLLVEDNDENWDMLSRRLQRRGHEVCRAADGVEAVDLALSRTPHVVLMDVNLPRMDGWEATRRIRADPRGADVPIIMLTAHAMSSDHRLADEVGADAYHAKPVELAELLRQIAALTDGRIDARDVTPAHA